MSEELSEVVKDENESSNKRSRKNSSVPDKSLLDALDMNDLL